MGLIGVGGDNAAILAETTVAFEGLANTKAIAHDLIEPRSKHHLYPFLMSFSPLFLMSQGFFLGLVNHPKPMPCRAQNGPYGTFPSCPPGS